MTPPPADSVAAMIRPAPRIKESKTNRDILAVMDGAPLGYGKDGLDNPHFVARGLV